MYKGCPAAGSPEPNARGKKLKHTALTTGHLFKWTGGNAEHFGYQQLQQVFQVPEIVKLNLGEPDPGKWVVLTAEDTEPWGIQSGEYYYLVAR